MEMNNDEDCNLKRVSRIRKTWLLSLPVHGLCLVLLPSFIEVSEAEQQYHTQPMDRCGAVLIGFAAKYILSWMYAEWGL